MSSNHMFQHPQRARAALVCAALMLGVAVAAVPPPATSAAGGADGLQTAVLSGGCFWGTQGVFEHVKGVHQVLAGYAGGDQATARYEMVGTGTTGHAESIQITFDSAVISYTDLLQIFFSVAHDPTELNRQGPDTGSQYRSEIFYANPEQQKIALDYIAQLQQSHVFRSAIVTRVDPLKGFYPAEHYHQDFLAHNPHYPYIVYNDLPKIENLKKEFPQEFVDTPVLVASTH
ncbi:MAG TPA: peptide-methionine (S)-S-oxide reductase MsrA [Steroidobacteraceae bacterium]|jgi:peptide-methionine (S)-S-oxide reductase